MSKDNQSVTYGFIDGGNIIGTMGNTGYVIASPGGDGTHLDVTIQKKNKWGYWETVKPKVELY